MEQVNEEMRALVHGRPLTPSHRALSAADPASVPSVDAKELERCQTVIASLVCLGAIELMSLFYFLFWLKFIFVFFFLLLLFRFSFAGSGGCEVEAGK
jgi:hypothetical protein